MKHQSKITFYDIPTLEEMARVFLDKYHDKKHLEVDIEYIAEAKLGWCIMPFSSLTDLHGIEAFAVRGKTIYIDQYLMDHKERKYRFTIAEELAHVILHEQLYEHCTSVEEHLDIYGDIKVEDYWRMDRNAKYLASAIILPAKNFEEKALEIYRSLDRKKYTTNEIIIYAIQSKLTELFNVNDIVVEIRFKNLGLHRKLLTL